MASLIKRSNGFYYLVTFLNGKRVWQSTGSKIKTGSNPILKEEETEIQKNK